MTLNMQVKMNKNGTIKSRGIEWTDATWNPIAGCKHACRWTMPDGKVAVCYAETIAERVAQSAYPEGFAHDYWKPHHLNSPYKKSKPLRIFVGSMADLFGHWVDNEKIEAILKVARECPQHTFQLLTKNPVRAKDFDMPDNVWLGASIPPDFMWGKALSRSQQERMLHRTMQMLADANASIKWMSFEPLSWDVSGIVEQYDVLSWAVIGAASDGASEYPPSLHDFEALLKVLDYQDVPVFYKGNLSSLSAARDLWREEFPRPSFVAEMAELSSQ